MTWFTASRKKNGNHRSV